MLVRPHRTACYAAEAGDSGHSRMRAWQKPARPQHTIAPRYRHSPSPPSPTAPSLPQSARPRSIFKASGGAELASPRPDLATPRDLQPEPPRTSPESPRLLISPRPESPRASALVAARRRAQAHALKVEEAHERQRRAVKATLDAIAMTPSWGDKRRLVFYHGIAAVTPPSTPRALANVA